MTLWKLKEISLVKTTESEKRLPCGRVKVKVEATPSPQQLGLWKQQLKTYLISQNLKYTEQRWKIVELILSRGGHIDAQDLVDQARKKRTGIGAATVYRSIKVLCEAKILKESLTDVHGKVFYELVLGDHHDHLVCVDCGEIFEFSDHKIESQQGVMLSALNFQEVGHKHVVYARCKYMQGAS